MDYTEEYNKKLTTPDEAVKCIKSGDWVDYGWAACTADVLDEALAKRMPLLENVNLRGGLLVRKPKIFDVENAKEHFTWNSWFMSAHERHVVKDGFVYFNPLRYSELPYFIHESLNPADVALMQVAPMDKHGYFSFGPVTSHMLDVVETAKTVIIEVNPTIPRCLGVREAVHISQVDMIVENKVRPMPTAPKAGEPSEIDRRIAEMIVKEIPNGACLQLGIGGMPNAVGMLIGDSDLQDLSVHTEMYVDAFVELTKKGKITGKYKKIQPGKQVYAFASGSRELMDFLDDNPGLMNMPVNYVNDIGVISSIDNFISINNMVDLDLYGQVNAESAGFKQISGSGGQLDFVMGAYLSRGGKSFLACTSTFKDKNGRIQSRIRPILAPGSCVTDTRANTMYLATEYGMFNCKGKSTWQRAEGIIGIAHPDFRDQLIAEAEKMGIWRQSNKR